MNPSASPLSKRPGFGRRAPRNRRERSSTPLVGIDMVSGVPQPRRRRGALPLVVAGLLAALFLAGLRTEIMRMGYESAEAQKLEQHLQEEKRRLTVEMRQLRDPTELGKQARALGFQHPERVLELRVHSTPTVSEAPPSDGV